MLISGVTNEALDHRRHQHQQGQEQRKLVLPGAEEQEEEEAGAQHQSAPSPQDFEVIAILLRRLVAQQLALIAAGPRAFELEAAAGVG